MRPLRRLLHTLSGWQYPADCFVSKAVSNYRRFPPQKPQQQQQNDILLFDFFKKDLTGELRPLAVTPQGPSPHSNLPVSEFHSEIQTSHKLKLRNKKVELIRSADQIVAYANEAQCVWAVNDRNVGNGHLSSFRSALTPSAYDDQSTALPAATRHFLRIFLTKYLHAFFFH